ncbi:hypothetical protein NJC38_11515 [Pseudomonas sp. 21LCFQ010]|uniref:hypothetical protein n=1 Tax=Pseudomonas sp. 21LCFQ010 TaxID=2957506 RepID=UPI0020969848|nr:hypothetical protein [Pseudomonas sp. 21LCFQ010]MCO8162796.1 hypothetical protein [Pseudomonas sp. 21LCFQ010]
MSATKPTWTTDIQRLVSESCWQLPLQRVALSLSWIEATQGQIINLRQIESVRQWSPLIYQHLTASTLAHPELSPSVWFEDSLEIFRRWVNQGWRIDAHAPMNVAERIARSPRRPLPEQPWHGHAGLHSHDRKPFAVRHLNLCREPARLVEQAPGRVGHA